MQIADSVVKYLIMGETVNKSEKRVALLDRISELIGTGGLAILRKPKEAHVEPAPTMEVALLNKLGSTAFSKDISLFLQDVHRDDHQTNSVLGTLTFYGFPLHPAFIEGYLARDEEDVQQTLDALVEAGFAERVAEDGEAKFWSIRTENL